MLTSEIRWAAGRVLLDPRRRHFLPASDVPALLRFLMNVLPLARAALAQITAGAERIPGQALRANALSTVQSKAYHVAGAAVLATFLPRAARERYVQVVAPLESIYDFLDTLCDRNPVEEAASRQLHEALFDALDPQRPLHDYFALGPGAAGDGGYLQSLVLQTRAALQRVPHLELLREPFRRAAQRYADTQTFKHLPAAQREPACIAWHAAAGDAEDLSWWEYCAAAGSQFHVYGPLFAAFCGRPESIGATYEAYFPDFAAVHVLLDSFIDRDEDRAHGELNWVACYPHEGAFEDRMRLLAQRSRERFAQLPSPGAHRFALRLMALFYLSHPKVAQQSLEREAARLLGALA